MALFRRRPPAKRGKTEEVITVPEIVDDQPRNPFTEIQLLTAHSDIVNLLMHIDDRRFVSASHDNTAVIWDAKWRKNRKLTLHLISELAPLHDKMGWPAFRDLDSNSRDLSKRTGCRLHVLQGHTRPITCMLVLHQGQDFQSEENLPLLLLTGSSDKTIHCAKVWDDEGHSLHTITDHNSSVKCLVSMKDESAFFSGGQNLCLWNKQGQLLSKLERKAEHSDIHTLLPIKNNRIVAASSINSLVVYSVADQSEDSNVRQLVEYKKLPFQHRESIRCLVSVADSMFASASLDGAIVLWSSHSLTCTKQFNFVKNYEGLNHMYPNSIQSAFTVEQRYIVACVGHGFALYDVISGKCLAQVQNAHYGKVLHSLFVCNGFLLVTCSEDGTVRLWGSSNPIFVEEGSASRFLSSPVEKFLGLSLKEIQNSKKPLEPALLGECLAHSGTVHMAVNCGVEGFASCGSDGLVVLWKDGLLQSERRSEMVQNILLYGGGV